MAFVQHSDVVQAVTTDAANHAFHISVLPRAARRPEHLFDTQAFHSLLQLASVNLLAIDSCGSAIKDTDQITCVDMVFRK